jgi:hypothetical protein
MVNPTEPTVIRNRLTAHLQDGGSYSQERNQLTLDEMVKREVNPASGRPTPLRQLFDYWNSKRVGNTAPSGAFNPKGLFTPDEFRWVSWVDVRHSDPMDFVLRSHPGFLFGDWSGKALHEYPNDVHARSLALEYLTCKMIQQPSYYEISQTVGSVSRTYMRLLLPVQGLRKPLTRLYYATRYVRYDLGDDESALPVSPAIHRDAE